MCRMLRYVGIVLLLLLCSSHEQVSAQPGISSDGREFFISMMQPPVFDGQLPPNLVNVFALTYKVKLLLTSQYENRVQISYYGSNGVESNSATYVVSPGFPKEILTDPAALTRSKPGEVVEYHTCHIVSSAPLSVLVHSVGPFCGAGYQALPVQCLGKKYVVMSYHDNPEGLGGIFAMPGTQKSEGFCIITAPFNGTTIEITPNSTTEAGQAGYHCGVGAKQTPHPFVISLNRGQSYTIRSAGVDAGCDLSETTISSSKPISVISGHDNANTDGSSILDIAGDKDWRDMMLEQLLPVECFDTTGFYTIPFQATENSTGGEGDEIKMYSNGLTPSTVTFRTDNTHSSEFSCVPFQLPVANKIGLTLPASLTSANGKPFAVMMYDQRSQGHKASGTAPSMASIIPRSHWKSEYSWMVRDETTKDRILANQRSYVNIICPKAEYSNGNLRISTNNGAYNKLSSAGLGLKATWNVIPGAPDLMGLTFSASPGSYRIVNTAYSGPDNSAGSFIVYEYGSVMFDQDNDFNEDENNDLIFEYAAPLGMVYKEFGLPIPKISATVTDKCDHWEVCINDSGSAQNGLKYIELLNYSNTSMLPNPGEAKNVAFDLQNDPLGKGEILFENTPQNFCFSIRRTAEPENCRAVVAIYDNSGQRFLLDLDKLVTPSVTLTGDLHQNTDLSYSFNSVKIDSTQIGTLTIKNSQPNGKVNTIISSIDVTGDPPFIISKPLPTVPMVLHPTDSIVLSIRFTPNDTLAKSLRIQLGTNCTNPTIFTINGRGLEAIINATDIQFSSVKPLKTECKNATISNLGSYPIRLTGFTLDDNAHFAVDPAFATSLPTTLLPGSSVSAEICFLPQEVGTFSGRIDWQTDMSDNSKIKSFTLLQGKSESNVGVSLSPNKKQFTASSSGSRIFITLGIETDQIDFDLFDILGRKVMSWKKIQSLNGQIVLPFATGLQGPFIIRMTTDKSIEVSPIMIYKDY